jgi:hypothetical protein
MGSLRYFASGSRNPFGIAADADGDLWVSTNGNSVEGFLSARLPVPQSELGWASRISTRVIRVWPAVEDALPHFLAVDRHL